MFPFESGRQLSSDKARQRENCLLRRPETVVYCKKEYKGGKPEISRNRSPYMEKHAAQIGLPHWREGDDSLANREVFFIKIQKRDILYKNYTLIWCAKYKTTNCYEIIDNGKSED